ncbi:14511_t:CDS:1, partial [Rhizophagus irregularis]
MVSEHYYWISVRVYYIFETSPTQIYRTVNTTVNLIRSLKQNEIKQL